MTEKRFIKICLLVASLWHTSCVTEISTEAAYEVVPLPRQIEFAADAPSFHFDRHTVIVTDSADTVLEKNCELFADALGKSTGIYALSGNSVAPEANYIRVAANLADSNSDAYTIDITADSIIVNGASRAGVFYGLQTLRKAVAPGRYGKVKFPAAHIYDYPRFAYRGAHLDCARHVFTPDSVKMFIDMLALHNVNRFHWHLTDDQGWRIEIKSRPELAEKGQWRSGTVIGAVKEGNEAHLNVYDSIPYGGYYTQEQIRDIVKYASDRHITIIPEIDMPGHMQAALHTYPELGCTGGPYEVWRRWGVSEDVLCAGNDEAYRLIDDILTEVVSLFPGEYVHIGGDECPKVRWENCPKCQAKIKKLGLKSDSHSTAEQKLQTFFMSHAADFLKNHCRKVIGWNEMIEGGLPDGAAVMSWVGIDGAVKAAHAGHDAILTPYDYVYFDFPQADQDSEPQAAHWGHPITVKDVYGFNPASLSLGEAELSHIIGVQGNLWSEYIPTMSHAMYMELPRLAALAEVQWGTADLKDYAAFIERLRRLTKHYDVNGYNYARHALTNQ